MRIFEVKVSKPCDYQEEAVSVECHFFMAKSIRSVWAKAEALMDENDKLSVDSIREMFTVDDVLSDDGMDGDAFSAKMVGEVNAVISHAEQLSGFLSQIAQIVEEKNFTKGEISKVIVQWQDFENSLTDES